MVAVADLNEVSQQQKKVNDCQRFFGYGKKIPKDVKRHCGICRQHGLVVETRKHLCQYKDCECWKCNLVRKRRSIMSTQIRLRREQDKKFQRTTDESEADIVPWGKEINKEKKEDINLCYFCQKCKNHGILMWKKDHKKNCEYAECRCVQCDLIDTRRALDRHIKKNKIVPKTHESSSSSEASSASSPAMVEATRQTSITTSSAVTVSNVPSPEIQIHSVTTPNVLPNSFGFLKASSEPANYMVPPTSTVPTTYTSIPTTNLPVLSPTLFSTVYPYTIPQSTFPLYSNPLLSQTPNFFPNLSVFNIQTMLASFMNMK